jgi:nucleotide-binding universal stress UspA family protein
MKNIIVAVDIEKKEELLVNKAIEMAKVYQAKLWIIHASAPDPDFVGFEAGPQSVRDERAGTLLKENKILNNYSDLAKRNGVEATGLLIQGPTIELILEECDKLEADLLILGHKKHGFIQRLIRGSIAGGIMENTKIPLMIIPLD